MAEITKRDKTGNEEDDEELDDDDSWEYDSESDDDAPWSNDVGEKGDLFYVQPPSLPVTSISINHNETENGLKSVAKHRKQKGIKKLKGLLSNKKREETQNNNHKSQINGNHSVKFQDKSGITKEIFLFVDPNRYNLGRRASLLESLVGIIPGTFSENSNDENLNSHGELDSRIMVQGMNPRGEALRSGQVKIGDWLKKVNDINVNFANIDSILSSIHAPKKLKLTIQRFALEAYITPPIVKTCQQTEALVQFITGEQSESIKDKLKKVPYAIMYLTLDVKSDDLQEKEDIMYQFPKQDNQLIDCRGLFVTISHLLTDVTSSPSVSSTVLSEGHVVHVGYFVSGKQALVIAFPAQRIPLQRLHHIVSEITRLINYLYGSLNSAFSPDNYRNLDHLFSIMCQHLLLKPDLEKFGFLYNEVETNFLDSLPGIPWLAVSEEAKNDVNNSLDDLESSDFGDMSDEYYDMRRSYTMLGSCLFHKGYLVSNHLSSSDLMDISFYCRYHCILMLTSQQLTGQLVIWREVFPTCRCAKKEKVTGYISPKARWFLLMVSMKHNLISILLEAGGCSEPAVGNPPPDPFYIDQAKATLLHLESVDLSCRFDQKLQLPSQPSLVFADWFFPSSKGSKDEQNKLTASSSSGNIPSHTSKNTHPESILKKSGHSESHKKISLTGFAESDADSIPSTSGNSGVSTPIASRRSFRNPSLGSEDSGESGGSGSLFRHSVGRRLLPSAFDRNGIGDGIDYDTGQNLKLTSGAENTLFHYINLDSELGVFISPNRFTDHGPMHKKLLENFHASCQSIRQTFERTLATRGKLFNNNSNLGLDTSLGGVYEQGVLFVCNQDGKEAKKNPVTMKYWVVGRLFFEPYPREIYVCFHESIPQNMVELAFKISFGLT